MQTLPSADNFAGLLRSPLARNVYFDLFDGQASARDLEVAEHFLSDQLHRVETVDSDLPDYAENLHQWMESGVEKVGLQYQQYLAGRKAGEKRRYFRSKSHALYFLKSVAPTKLVDGAWLYGLLPRWQDARFLALIQTYLEELGEGVPGKNHVLLYKKLLSTQGCERWDDLTDAHYVQGALQLALAYHAERFLPEVIGFNLGYEQLPLHLLITAYELKELGIDPYYFTLHVTVDNADSGHAKKAVEAIFASMPKMGNAQEWYRRVQNGYKLNDLGESTNSVTASFDLQAELCRIFARKGTIGQYVHSDYRRVAGRTVNEWLADASQTTEFVAAMESEGWFKRHQDPQYSRFWKLIQSEKAKMFGVFSAYEQQVIYDWIAGDALEDGSNRREKAVSSRMEGKPRSQSTLDMRKHDSERDVPHSESDFDEEIVVLQERLAALEEPEETLALLIALMSPANHHTAPGLLATRRFCEMLG